MDPLAQNTSLRDLQTYVAKLEVERGFDGRSTESQCLKLCEEVGELAGAVGALTGQPQDVRRRRSADVGDEAADVLLMLLAVVNRSGVDLEDALRRKEARNNTRQWR